MRPKTLQLAISQSGGVTRLAAVLGIKQPSVSQWNRVPAERCLAVEKISGVSRHLLRPDIYPYEAANDNYPPFDERKTDTLYKGEGESSS